MAGRQLVQTAKRDSVNASLEAAQLWRAINDH